MKRWLARAATRTAIGDYFGYRRALKPSIWDVLTVIAYASTLPASKIGAGVFQWLTLVAFVVVFYYFFAFVFMLSNLGSTQSRLKLSCVFGSIFGKPLPNSPYVRDLISYEVIPKELKELAFKTVEIEWWAKRYWRAEAHEERKTISDIVQRILKCSRVELDLRARKVRYHRLASGREALMTSSTASPSTHNQSLFLDTQEEFLSFVPIELAWKLRLDPAFQSMIDSCVQHAEGSKEQRRDVKRVTDYICKQIVADGLHVNHAR